MEGRRQLSANPIAWWEIEAPDLDTAKAFYGGVFGWTFKPWMDGYEGIHLPDDSMIGGLRRAEGDPAGRKVHVCFTVDFYGDDRDDTLEQTLQKVDKYGGRTVVGRTEIGSGMGWYATAEDPSGLKFDLWSGRPAD
jgi:uncharacterized protein